MKHRKITTILILSTVFMGLFSAMNINLSTSETSISKTLNSKTLNLSSLEVRGKWITDASGNEVQLRGVAVTELQAIYEGHRSHAKPTTFEDIIDLIDVFGFKVNTIRLTIHPYVDDETGKHGWTLDYNSKNNIGRYFLKMNHNDYFNLIINPAVNYCVSKGYYVILDWHGISNFNIKTPQNQAETVEFWNYMCGKYANHPSVIFELLNEPCGIETWLEWMPYPQGWIDAIRSGNWSQYQPLIDQVNDVLRPAFADRDICQIKYNTTTPANNLILVGGPSHSKILPHYDKYDNWDIEPYNESLFFTGGNIAYVNHIYPTHSTPRWFFYTARFHPVVITEWGYEAEGPAPTYGTLFWGNQFKEYLIGWPNVGWIAWCFDYIYHSYMFDCEWNLLGNGDSDPTTRYHDNQCIYINTIPDVVDKQFKKGFETPPDTYENYFGYFVKDWLEELEPAPKIRHPEDISIDFESTGNSITWIAIDKNPTTYTVTRNGTQVDSGSWSSAAGITVSVDGLPIGSYNYTCIVTDGDGLSNSDSFTVTVVPVTGGDVWFSSITTQTVGDTFETEIYVDTGSQNLLGYQFNITYNKDVIQIASRDDIEAGDEGLVYIVDFYNYKGYVRISGFDEWGIGPKSQLHLATITWTAVSEGTSSLDLTIINLIDTNRTIIGTPNDIDGSVVVERGPEITPMINMPQAVSYQEGTTGHSITWIAIDDNPTTYNITRNGTQVDSGSWSSGVGIMVSVDGLSEGSYNYTCTVNDGDGLFDSFTARINVVPISVGNVWFSSITPQTVGDTFETEIYVNTGSQNLGAYELRIGYHDILTGKAHVQIASDDDIRAGSEGFVSEVNIDNENAFVTITGFNAAGTGPSSQLHLLTITWTTVSAGISSLDLSIDSLNDTDAIEIGTPNDIDGSVIVKRGPEITPVLNSPRDVYYQESTSGHSIIWKTMDNNPTTYTVTRNGQQVDSGLWSSGNRITINIDGLSDGYHTYTCTVNDGDGFSDTDSVRVRVVPVTIANVWFSSVSTQTVGDTFETEIYVNTGSQNLGAYKIDIIYYWRVIQILSEDDIVAGNEGFVSTVDFTGRGKVSITGFEPLGTGPNSQLHLLTITWTAISNGVSSLILEIGHDQLVDSDGNSIGFPHDIDSYVVVEGDPEIDPEMDPILNSPRDVYYQEGTTGHSITWRAIDNNPTTYTVTQNGNQVASGSWSSAAGITVSVDDLLEGSYTYICTVNDRDGSWDSDFVTITVGLEPGGDVWFSSVSTQTVGDNFETEIYVNTGSQDLGAYGFDINYNEDVIQIASVNDIVAGAEGFISAVNLDNINGLVRIAGFEAFGTGPNSQLHLLTITWIAVGEGSSSLDLSINDLADANIITIGTPNDIDGSVLVERASAQAPVLNSPSDVSYQEGETGNSITWTATDDNPTTYTVTQNGTIVESGSWDSGNPITINVDGLSFGLYIYTITVYDGSGNDATDSVYVLVHEVPEVPGGGDIPGYDLFIFLGSLWITILAMIYLRKRRQ